MSKADSSSNKRSLGVMVSKQLKIKFKELEINELKSQYDLINLCIYELSIDLSSLFPHVGTQSLGGKKTDPKLILETMARSLKSAMRLCNECGFDMPDSEDFAAFEDAIPLEIQQDTMLSILDALSFLHSVACSIYVNDEGNQIWDEPEMPEDFYEGILGLVNNIINIASKFGYRLDDILKAM